MNDLQLIVRIETMVFRGRHPATGVVFLRIGESSFPEPEWNDFVVVILGWFAGAVARISSAQATSERVDFMDGPFAVELTREPPSSTLRVRGSSGPERDREEFLVTTDLAAFASSVAEAASRVLSRCREAGHLSRDVTQLEVALTALRSASPPSE